MKKQATKTASPKKPRKKAAAKATAVAKPTTTALVKDQKAAAPSDTHRKMLQVCARHGIVLSYQQLQTLSDEHLLAVDRWCATVDQSLDEHVPPIPKCLLDFATKDVLAKLGPPIKEGLPPRRSLACEFGAASIGDGTARIPVTIDGEIMDPNEAAEYLRGRRIEVVISRETASANQKKLPGLEDTPDPVTRLTAVCDVKKFAVGAKSYGFSVTLPLQEIDPGLLAKFAMRTGRIELQVLGDAEEHPKGGTAKEPPHPDVAAGADRPHGTPHLEELAKAQRAADHDDDDDADDSPATVPFPSNDGDKLYLCENQIARSLRLAAVTTVPIDELYNTWNDEDRDEIDTWAKLVVAHAAYGQAAYGRELEPLPAIPGQIAKYLPPDQTADPIGYARDAKVPDKIHSYCRLCHYEWKSNGDSRCPECDAGDIPGDVTLIGFYGDQHVDRAGDFITDSVEEYQVIRQTSDRSALIRVIEGDDKRWRAAAHAEIKTPDDDDPERDTINEWPNIRDAGYPRQQDAIAAALGKLIDRWSKLAIEGVDEAVAELKESLGKISAGVDPLDNEQEL